MKPLIVSKDIAIKIPSMFVRTTEPRVVLFHKTGVSSHITNQEKRPAEASHFFLAGDEGFEPPNVGTKSRCLTTWRIPNAGLRYT